MANLDQQPACCAIFRDKLFKYPLSIFEIGRIVRAVDQGRFTIAVGCLMSKNL